MGEMKRSNKWVVRTESLLVAKLTIVGKTVVISPLLPRSDISPSISPIHANQIPKQNRKVGQMEATNLNDGEVISKPRDIRKYYCKYCGICRSKKSLLRCHILTHHKDEVKEDEADSADPEMDTNKKVGYACTECGASFRKPAYLKQHMLGHSVERQFTCPFEDCYLSYRRKDHLNRHLLKHEGKLFVCPVENCNKRFAFQGNMTRHVHEMHDDDSSSEGEKQHACTECGKCFKYPSKLRKHEESHVKLEYVEVICSEPGCLKPFTNADCLKAHIQSCHLYVECEICGTQQMKKNFKRHLRLHEDSNEPGRIECTFKGCQYTFSNKSNLNKHVKAVHEELRPFVCGFSGCGLRFPYKHVRDNHEKSGAHVHLHGGDFFEADERWRSRPRGGRKRKDVSVEMLARKRVAPLSQDSSPLDDGSNYLRWLLSDD